MSLHSFVLVCSVLSCKRVVSSSLGMCALLSTYVVFCVARGSYTLAPAIAEDQLPETQCGFRANRGTTDMVFVLRQIQEKCQEQNKALYVTFVDLTKAFDTVSRQGLWKIMEKLGCSPKFLTMIIQLHEDQLGQVRHSNDFLQPFPIANGVKQGCVLAVHHFSYLGCVISPDAKIDKEVDNRLAKANSAFSRLYRHVWNNNNLKKDTKVSVYKAVVLTTLLYHVPPSPETPRAFPSALPPHNPQHSWCDFVANTEVFESAEVTSIETMVLKVKLCWVGHVSMMENCPLATAKSGHHESGTKTP